MLYSPLNASGQSNCDADVFDLIISDLSSLKHEHPNSQFLVCGDINGQTGLLPHYIIADHAAYLPLPDDHTENIDTLVKRSNNSNKDRVVNGQGKRLIELCKMCNLRVVNGRVGEDRSRGRITCVTYNGQSVMDYVLCSPSLFARIRCFQLLNPN